MPITRYGFDVNEPGTSLYPRTATRIQSPYLTGMVVDIILDNSNSAYLEDGSNIGFAKIRMLPFDTDEAEENLNWVPPLDTNIQQFPSLGEKVLLVYADGGMKYQKISSNNKITINSSIEQEILFTPRTSTVEPNIDANLRAAGVRTTETRDLRKSSQLILPFTKAIQPTEGDVIIQGRFGASIRLGSNKFQPRTAFDNIPSPNLLLTVGPWTTPTEFSTKVETEYSLVYEDINNNSTCLWMVTNQQVDFKASTVGSPAHLRGSEVDNRIVPYYTGAQIFANSDRIIINSKLNEIALFSKAEINLSAIKSITISSENNVSISSNVDVKLKADDDIFIKGKNISLKAADNFSNNVTGNYTILGQKIFIGATTGDTTQPMVLGGSLAQWLQRLMQILLSPGLVITTTPGTPATLNPVQVTALNGLRSDLGSIASPQSAVFNSRDNFTSKTNRV